MKDLQGRVAAVTGAASGIGRSLAVALAKAGCKLALSDVDRAGLEQTLALTKPASGEALIEVLDVSNREAVYAHADRVRQTFGRVNLVFNNAGMSVGATVPSTSYEDFDRIMAVNFWGVVYGTRAFLPHLIAAGEGHIVNVSSAFGLIAAPAQSAYNASKFAVRGFTESLRIELDVEGCGVSCSCVHPGGVKTNIARNSRVGDLGKFGRKDADPVEEFDKLARMTADDAARVIIEGVRKNKRRILVGADAYLLDALQRMMPAGYQKVMARFGRQ